MIIAGNVFQLVRNVKTAWEKPYWTLKQFMYFTALNLKQRCAITIDWIAIALPQPTFPKLTIFNWFQCFSIFENILLYFGFFLCSSVMKTQKFAMLICDLKIVASTAVVILWYVRSSFPICIPILGYACKTVATCIQQFHHVQFTFRHVYAYVCVCECVCAVARASEWALSHACLPFV